MASHPRRRQPEIDAAQANQVARSKPLRYLDPSLPASYAARLIRRLFRQGDLDRHYRVLRTLSSKYHSRVELATRRRDDLPCLLKIVRQDIIESRGAFNELEALTLMRHDQIPRCRHAGRTTNGDYWLELEYIDGELLSTYIDAQQKDAERIADASAELETRLWILRQLIRSVNYVHWCGWIHGDINPANVIYSPGTGRLVLIDFEFARPTKVSESEQTPRTHSLDYAAPEEVSSGLSSRAADLYAVGKLGGELLLPYDQLENDVLSSYQKLCVVLVERVPEARIIGLQKYKRLWEGTK